MIKFMMSRVSHSDEECGNCKFYRQGTSKLCPEGWMYYSGVEWYCHRLPVAEQKYHADWCGEWRLTRKP